MKCPFKFGNYDFEGGQDCIGVECGMFKRCNADDEITAVEFDALDEHAQALERENAELKARVDELTEDYKASSNGLEILTLKNAELQTQVNNLNSENAKLSSDELHLRQALASAEFDNATLRDKLGRMLDNAHEIERIGQI